MFTGIIRDLGTITKITPEGEALRFSLATKLTSQLGEGDSLAVNGTCLTILEKTSDSVVVRLMPETLERTNLGALQEGGTVNLELPITASQRLDGHIVDGLAKVAAIKVIGPDKVFTFEPPRHLLPYLIPKGSVALDGVSLTVVEVADAAFTVAMMPYTLDHTTFGKAAVGYQANIEVDVVGKYVERFIKPWQEQ
jgi:riboflavin synthase